MKLFSPITRIAIVLATATAPLLGGTAADATKLFEDRCSACHSIGGGDLVGPDLVAAKKLGDSQLRAAIVRMQESAGTLTPAEIDSLVALLKGPVSTPAPKPVVAAGSAAEGRRLFCGEKRLQNGGAACGACHEVSGRGGNLAVTLTGTRLGATALQTAAERPGFPMMKAAYVTHAVTPAEAADIAAFIASAKANRTSDTQLVHGAAAGIAAIFFGAVFVMFRTRRSS